MDRFGQTDLITSLYAARTLNKNDCDYCSTFSAQRRLEAKPRASCIMHHVTLVDTGEGLRIAKHSAATQIGSAKPFTCYFNIDL